MEERRRAELLVVRLRWAALIAGALMVDDYTLKPAPILLVCSVFIYNTLAAQITSDKNLFAKYGYIVAPATRVLDVTAIALASCSTTSAGNSLYLLYGFVIVGTAHSYNRVSPTVVALTGCMALDALCVFHRLALIGSADQTLTQISQHAAALLAAALIAMYIIALRKQDESMRMKERKLSALFESGTRFTSAHDLNQLLAHILATAVSETGATGGWALLVDSNSGELSPCAIRNTEDDQSENLPDDDLAIERWVVSTGQAALLQSGSTEEAPDVAKPVTRPTMCVPLVERNTSGTSGKHNPHAPKVVGTLTVYSDRPTATFGQEDLDLLRTLAIHASMGVVNARLYRELHNRFLKTLQSLVRSLEARDPYTQGHSNRVAEISQIVASQLGLPDGVVKILGNAALLHDIGKIGVPDSVLQKPSKLTPEERLVIQSHSTTGENICYPLDLGDEVLFLIRHHQERLNGSGYPDRLPADQQPLPLRILCAVDALDAMSSDRPYRKALSAAERVEQLNRAAGAEFDPVVVEVLKSLLSSGVLDRFYLRHDEDEDKLLKAA